MDNPDYTEVEKYEEYLPCILSEKELIEKSRELARAKEDLASAEDRKKDVMADITAQIKKHEANIGLLARIVSQGKEYRQVKCELIRNFTKGFKSHTRLDTGEVLKSIPIETKERQSTLA